MTVSRRPLRSADARLGGERRHSGNADQDDGNASGAHECLRRTHERSAVVSWWVSLPGGNPAGPVRTEALLQAIAVGWVPRHTLVCRAGETDWSPVAGIQRF